MLMIMAGILKPYLKTGIQTSFRAFKARYTLPTLGTPTTQRFFSQGQTVRKEFTIKDHDEFDEKVLNNDHPVVVNFHAEWCEPCQKLTPQLHELFDDSNEIDLAMIDVDHNTELLETFGVKAVPAVIAFNNGRVMDKFIGLVDDQRLDILIEKLQHKDSQRISQ